MTTDSFQYFAQKTFNQRTEDTFNFLFLDIGLPTCLDENSIIKTTSKQNGGVLFFDD